MHTSKEETLFEEQHANTSFCQTLKKCRNIMYIAAGVRAMCYSRVHQKSKNMPLMQYRLSRPKLSRMFSATVLAEVKIFKRYYFEGGCMQHMVSVNHIRQECQSLNSLILTTFSFKIHIDANKLLFFKKSTKTELIACDKIQLTIFETLNIEEKH